MRAGCGLAENLRHVFIATNERPEHNPARCSAWRVVVVVVVVVVVRGECFLLFIERKKKIVILIFFFFALIFFFFFVFKVKKNYLFSFSTQSEFFFFSS